MTMPKDGGPAFPFDLVDFQPTTGDQVMREQFPGMSLRQWYMGKALESIDSVKVLLDAEPENVPKVPFTIATFARQIADAMMMEACK